MGGRAGGLAAKPGLIPSPVVAEALKRLPFDLYGRYRLAADIATRLGARRMLDVGGGPGVLGAFCEDAHAVAVDVSLPTGLEPAQNLVLGDGAHLPFRDGTFDLVVALDTLEHVEPDRRSALLGESARVARGWVLVVGPCATPGVTEADVALLSFVRAKFGEAFPTVETLTEHLVFGHPEPASILTALEGAGAEVASFPSGRLDRWLPMMILFHELLALGREDPVERVQAWYNDAFYRDDLRAPAYRQAMLARLPDAEGPTPESIARELLPAEESPALDATALEALSTIIAGPLTDVMTVTAARTAELERKVVESEDRIAALTERAEAAEDHVRLLLEFRDRVLKHPAVRLRGRLRGGRDRGT